MIFKKKAQVTFFVIIGIFILFTIAVIMHFYFLDRTSLNTSGSQDSDTIKKEKNYIEMCAHEEIDKSVKEEGFGNLDSLKISLEPKIKDCIDSYEKEDYRKINSNYNGINLFLSNDDNTLFMDLDYYFSYNDKNSASSKDGLMIDYPLSSEYKIPTVNNVLTKDLIITSPNNQIRIFLKEGTLITDMEGKSPEKITIKIKNPEQYKGINRVPIGLVYEFEPDYLSFYPPVRAEFFYGDNYKGNEDKLQLGYYVNESREWLRYEVPSVDKEDNKAIAYIPHFTPVSTTEEENGTGTCETGERMVHKEGGWCFTDCNTGGPCPDGEINCDCYSSCSAGDTDRCLRQIEEGGEAGSGGEQGEGGAVTGFHHYNPRAHDGTGVSIILCPGESASGCKLNGMTMSFKSMDKGREQWSIMKGSVVGTSGTITCTSKDGGSKSFSVSGYTNGHC